MNNKEDVKIYIPIRYRKRVIREEDVMVKEPVELDYSELGEKIIKETSKLLDEATLTLKLKK